MNNIYLGSMLLLFVYFSLVFIIAQLKKNNAIVDIAWGFGFVLVAINSYLTGSKTFLALIVTTLVLLWGLRLSYHLFKRNWNRPEDYRYVEMRHQWGNKHPLLQAYLKVYMAQMILLFLVSQSIIFINMNGGKVITLVAVLGIIIWVIGYFFEVVGDYQLKEFISNVNNKGKIMKYGLWKYTRHPNYFGEVTMWWGIYIMSLSVGGIFTIISPLLITYLIIYVTGIPLLEKKYANNAEFKEYKDQTSVFFPLRSKNK